MKITEVNYSWHKKQSGMKINPSFGLRNTRAALYRAQKLKKAYNAVGLKYLLPDEVWNNKKIFETLEKFDEKLNLLIESKNVNKKSVQKLINSLLPENKKNQIIIKIFRN